jgi:ubiquitin-conjugating enzyme E2 I
MSDSLARNRLTEERKEIAKNRPAGMWARPVKAPDGSIDLFKWHFGVRPKASSLYALPDDGTYRVRVEFTPTYPQTPPLCSFDPPIFHTNVWPNGNVCLSLLLEAGHHPGAGHHGYWQAGRTFSEILIALSTFLDDPNPESVANATACTIYKKGKVGYENEIRKMVKDYPALLLRKLEAEKKK